MREGHSVQGSKSEVTAQHHQDLTFESPTQVFVSMELPQKGPSVTTGHQHCRVTSILGKKIVSVTCECERKREPWEREVMQRNFLPRSLPRVF